MRRFRLRGIRVTPPLVISMIALFVALAGTGWAQNAVPLAKRALTANKAKVATNALKLNGRRRRRSPPRLARPRTRRR